MKKFLNKYKFHILSFTLIFISLIFTFAKYNVMAFRFVGAIKNFGASFSAFFSHYILGNENTFTGLNSSTIDLIDILPFDTNEVIFKLQHLGNAIFNLANFKVYFIYSLLISTIAILYIVLIILFIQIAKTIFSILLTSPSDEPGTPTSALQFFIDYIEKPLLWFFGKVKRFLVRFKKTWYYILPFVAIWLFNLNVISIFFEFFAWYFGFPLLPTLEGMLGPIATLILDLILMFNGAPFIFWLVLGLYIFDKIRKAIAYDRLDHMLKKDMGYINKLSLAVMLTGTMGVSKTMTITVMMLINSIMMRDNAYNTMFKYQMAFPKFPFLRLEKSILENIDKGKIKNLYGVRRHIRRLFKEYKRTGSNEAIFGYDSRMYFDNSYNNVTLEKGLTEYAQAYYVYAVHSSLLVTAYGVREDLVQKTIGNFPLWDKEIFKRKSDTFKKDSLYSHILDFNILRIGVKVEDPYAYLRTYEFGILGVAEYGKERGNQFKTKGMKADSKEANQLNDLLSYTLKLLRHPSTIDYEPYSRIYVDEQRCMSLNADERELFDIISVKEKSDIKLSMPGFFLAELINSTLIKWFRKFWGDVRYNGQEFSLPAYLLLRVFSLFSNYYLRIYDTFGYFVSKIQKQAGTLDGSVDTHDFYMPLKIAFSDRYSTDCYKPFFDETIKNTKYGLFDFPTYKDIVATSHELKLQNSFFVNELYDNFIKS
ncbi:MAG: hypothetical protein IJ398_02035 [Clostridia bacterium]|nr:hypothetical protein [Clostridia bacterium]